MFTVSSETKDKLIASNPGKNKKQVIQFQYTMSWGEWFSSKKEGWGHRKEEWVQRKTEAQQEKHSRPAALYHLPSQACCGRMRDPEAWAALSKWSCQLQSTGHLLRWLYPPHTLCSRDWLTAGISNFQASLLQHRFHCPSITHHTLRGCPQGFQLCHIMLHP